MSIYHPFDDLYTVLVCEEVPFKKSWFVGLHVYRCSRVIKIGEVLRTHDPKNHAQLLMVGTRYGTVTVIRQLLPHVPGPGPRTYYLATFPKEMPAVFRHSQATVVSMLDNAEVLRLIGGNGGTYKFPNIGQAIEQVFEMEAAFPKAKRTRILNTRSIRG